MKNQVSGIEVLEGNDIDPVSGGVIPVAVIVGVELLGVALAIAADIHAGRYKAKSKR